MNPDLEAFKKAGAMLDKMAIPAQGISCWMTRSTFLSLGGTQESWDSLEGKGDLKLIQSEPNL